MNILHIWDNAGVSCIISKYQRKLGHIVEVVKQKKDDELGFLEYYGDNSSDLSPDAFDSYVIKISRAYDIVHCHSLAEIASIIKSESFDYNPKQKVFIHYHGSDLRQEMNKSMNEECNNLVDGIFYSTPDLKELLPDRAKYIPTIVDTELFFHKGKGGNGITFNRDHIKCKYSYTPHFYRQFDTFDDTKVVLGQVIPCLSKTAYECLALGLKVVDRNGQVYEKLPEKHKPENVVKLINDYYNLLEV